MDFLPVRKAIAQGRKLSRLYCVFLCLEGKEKPVRHVTYDTGSKAPCYG